MTKMLKLLPFLILLASAALAHEFWLEAPRFRLQPGDTVNVHTFIGADFKGEPWTTKATKIQRLVHYGPIRTDSTDFTPKKQFWRSWSDLKIWEWLGS